MADRLGQTDRPFAQPPPHNLKVKVGRSPASAKMSSDDPFACFGDDDEPTQSDTHSEDPFACFGGDDAGVSTESDVNTNNTSRTNDSKVGPALQAQRLRQEAEARQAYAQIASSPTGIQPLHIVKHETYADRFEVYECSQQDGYATGQMGVKATKAYKVGEEVLREYPSMRVCTSHPASCPEEAEAKFARAVQEAYDACSDNTQAAIMDLSSCREDNGADITGRTLQGVFATNTYALGQGATHGGLFLTLSRLNHSCRSNCVHHWRPDLHMMVVHAVRDIDIGEELCTCYGPGDSRLTNERQEYLKERYNFDCLCDMCREGTDVQNDGDKREYDRINRFHDNLPSLTSLNPTRALGKVEECLELLRQLQLGEAHFVPIYHFGYEISRHGLRDLSRARSYLEREVVALEHSQGDDSYGAIDTRNLLQKLDAELSS